MLEEPADLTLLTRIATQDAAALRLLYDRHGDKVYNLALSYLQVTEDAEEVTQDVFGKVWRSAGSFAGNSQVTTWLYRIAVNTALTKLKKRNTRSLFGALSNQLDPPDFAHPGALLEDMEENKALFSAVYRLPDRQKTAFLLSYVEELPRAEVATIMNQSLKAVEGLLMRAKGGLRETLKNSHPHRGRSN